MNPPAFLIDRDEQVLTPVERPQVVGQRPDLIAAGDIAAEQDVPRRVRVLEEGAFVRGQNQTGKAENRGNHATNACRNARA